MTAVTKTLLLVVAAAAVAAAAPLAGEAEALLETGSGSPLVLRRAATLSELPGWEADSHAHLGMLAFYRSCRKSHRLTAFHRFTPMFARNQAAWKAVCAKLKALLGGVTSPLKGPANARAFLEENFHAYSVKVGDKGGFFTSYYAPVIDASLTKTPEFSVPVYGLPHAYWGPEKKRTYDTRGAIMDAPEAFAKQAPVLCYLRSWVEEVDMATQGTAMVRLRDNSRRLLQFEASNRQPFTSMGKILIDGGYYRSVGSPRDAKGTPEFSLDAMRLMMREMLRTDPAKALALIKQNKRFAFFRMSKKENVVGATGAELYPRRSLAVDWAYTPRGCPLWVDIHSSATAPDAKSRRLMVAQDTGSAIKGGMRGDIYAGIGAEAFDFAKRVQNAGSWWMLLPKQFAVTDGAQRLAPACETGRCK